MPSRRGLARYLRRSADALGLHRRRITALSDPPRSEDDDAEVIVHAEARRAEVRFGPGFWEASAADKRRIVAHELVHCLTMHTIMGYESVIVAHAPPAAVESLLALLTDQYERDTEALALLLAPRLPVWVDRRGG